MSPSEKFPRLDTPTDPVVRLTQPYYPEVSTLDNGLESVRVDSLSDEMADAVVTINPPLAIDNQGRFPNLHFTMEHVKAMIDAGELQRLILDCRVLMSPEQLQYVVNEAIDNDPSCIEYFIDELPETIKISEERMVQVATYAPKRLYLMLLKGKFSELRSNSNVLKILFSDLNHENVVRLISDDLFAKLSIVELADLLGGSLRYDAIDRLLKAGRLTSEESVYDLIKHVNVWGMMSRIPELPTPIQSCMFREIVTGRGRASDWVYYLDSFRSLQEEDYEFLLEHVGEFLDKGVRVSSINHLFEPTDGEVLYRFEHEALPKIAKINEETRMRALKNDRREQQREIEDGYFRAGNIKLSPYGYEGQLSDQDIIDGYEHRHCVREIGVLRDIARDTTRTNEVMGVETAHRKTSYDLGASVYEEDRVIRTEHEALQQLLRYLDGYKEKMLDETLLSTFVDELSYVGEKEYAEAVKGIATYWKWFLDQDDNNQLYVDTVVSNSDGSTKSDTYMFDRILEHFSDDDMEKYWGRLLTKGVDIIQDDPSKVKVVLLDDWTISGAQLRTGYTAFARRHPGLVSSIEVQLIAASAERVAMGIEKASYRATSAQSKDISVPIVTRAYYVAHKADTATGTSGARITGSHSSVDFGFVNDLSAVKLDNDDYPLLANIVRNYRQAGYEPKNIERLKKLYGIYTGLDEAK